MRIIGIDPGYAITGFGVIDYQGNHFNLIKSGAIETKAGNQRITLKPGDAPEARFLVREDDEVLAVYEYCNLHGLYKA